MNVVLNILPGAYRQGDMQENIADALTAGASDMFVGWDEIINNYHARYLDPATCKPEWLDYLSQLAGWGELWDSSWSVANKRTLIAHSDYIWRIRGSKLILPYLFDVFGLQAALAPSTGFILNKSLFPSSLDADPFSYTINVPPSYVVGSPEYTLISRLVTNFLPCWVTINIVVSS